MAPTMVPAVERERAINAYKAMLLERGINPRAVTDRTRIYEDGFLDASAVAERSGKSLAQEAQAIQDRSWKLSAEIDAIQRDAPTIDRFVERAMTILEEDSPAEDRLEKMRTALSTWAKLVRV